MITSLRLKDFKNFADETLRVGEFTLIVGANASGKSNLLDAFRFLHGIGRGYTLTEIAAGKREAGWKPIRGAANEIIRFKADGETSEVDRFSLDVEMDLPRYSLSPGLTENNARYRIEVGRENSNGCMLSIVDETLWINARRVYSASASEDHEALPDRVKPALCQTPHRSHSAEHFNSVGAVARQLKRARFFTFDPDRLREPAFPGQTVLGDSGEHLPFVLRAICADPKRKSNLASWLRGLTPMEVEDFEFPSDPSGRIHLIMCESNGARVSADCASDTTLRFLAMLAVLLGDDPSCTYFFEEIEKGLHPSRVHLLIDLIERATSDGAKQVIATTNSPELLSMVRDSTFESTSVVCRLEEESEAVIRPVAELHNARRLRKTHGLGRLLAGRWMETAVAFAE